MKNLTYQYFLEEYHRFRKIMCSPDYSTTDKMNAWRGLLCVYVNTETQGEEEDKNLEIIMVSLKTEFDRRLIYEETLPLSTLASQINTIKR